MVWWITEYSAKWFTVHYALRMVQILLFREELQYSLVIKRDDQVGDDTTWNWTHQLFPNNLNKDTVLTKSSDPKGELRIIHTWFNKLDVWTDQNYCMICWQKLRSENVNWTNKIKNSFGLKVYKFMNQFIN